VLPAVSFSVLEPEPGAGRTAGVKADVTPVGSPVTDRVTAVLKPADTDEARFTEAVPPVAREIDPEGALTWKLGTVTASVQ
jgi:hypothetical protein